MVYTALSTLAGTHLFLTIVLEMFIVFTSEKSRG